MAGGTAVKGALAGRAPTTARCLVQQPTGRCSSRGEQPGGGGTVPGMADVRLRPYRADDGRVFHTAEQGPGAIDFFGFHAENDFARRFTRNGLISEEDGNLAVVVHEQVVGDVGWHAVHHGPPPHGRALNIGVGLLPEFRGRGHGTAAQRLLAEHLFATTRIERLEAVTDVLNLAEQRALEKAGFTREGVLRHLQWQAGAFHDCVLSSRLRDD